MFVVHLHELGKTEVFLHGEETAENGKKEPGQRCGQPDMPWSSKKGREQERDWEALKAGRKHNPIPRVNPTGSTKGREETQPHTYSQSYWTWALLPREPERAEVLQREAADPSRFHKSHCHLLWGS